MESDVQLYSTFSCCVQKYSPFYRGLFSSSDSSSLDNSKLCRACILGVSPKISSKSCCVSDFTECQVSDFGTAMRFQRKAWADPVSKPYKVLATQYHHDFSVIPVSRLDNLITAEGANLHRLPTKIQLFNKILFSTGTRPIFNINSSKFPRTDSSNFNYSKISISSPDSTIGTSVVGIADPLLQHPFRNRGPEGAGSRRANLGEPVQVPENAEIATREPK